MQVEFHTILTGSHRAGALENHALYCERLGYRHVVHSMTSPTNRQTDVLFYRYSRIRQILWMGARHTPGRTFVFADESAAIYAFIPAESVIGARSCWIATCSFSRLPDGAVLMFRADESALRIIDSILDQVSTRMISGMNRWDGEELRHLESIAMGEPLEGGHFPSLNFLAHGGNLPEVSTFFLSFNERIRNYRHDSRLADVFMRYLAGVQRRHGRLYDDFNDDAHPAPFEVVNPGKPVGVISAYTPNIVTYARLSVHNVAQWCCRHGYTHYIYHDLDRASLDPGTRANWAKAELLLRHIDSHEYVSWIDADILVIDQARGLTDAVDPGAPATFYRDVGGASGFNNGFMVFASCDISRAYLQRVRAQMAAVEDRSSVYASGGDQHYFVQAWQDAEQMEGVLLDSMTANTHPVLLDDDTWMIHYAGIPGRIRAVYMRHDMATLVR
ncbi:hypothetical protein ACS0Y7_35455 [Burkholderia gladioli]|uniref:hypothetical protein n=1 Tax=Burkholderia gladioli TaxID=28095 RepID=UPI003F78BCB5